jgi:hypothetical protein
MTIGVPCPDVKCTGRITFPVPEFSGDVSMKMVYLKKPQECPECKKDVKGSVVFSRAVTYPDGTIGVDIGPYVSFAPKKASRAPVKS